MIASAPDAVPQRVSEVNTSTGQAADLKETRYSASMCPATGIALSDVSARLERQSMPRRVRRDATDRAATERESSPTANDVIPEATPGMRIKHAAQVLLSALSVGDKEKAPMADDAVVEISMGGRTFKFAGSEAFVEKMIDVLPTLLPASVGFEQELERGNGDDVNAASSAREHETIDAFVNRLGINNETSGTRKVGAFVYYLTESLRSRVVVRPRSKSALI